MNIHSLLIEWIAIRLLLIFWSHHIEFESTYYSKWKPDFSLMNHFTQKRWQKRNNMSQSYSESYVKYLML